MPSKPKYISKERIENRDGSIDIRSIQTSLDKLIDNVNSLILGILGEAKLIKEVVVTEGATSIIKHGLGKELKGYIVVLSNAELNIYDLQADNPRKSTELWLTADSPSSATSTITLLVF